MWELWTLRYKKARVSDEKARKSTQNEEKTDAFAFGTSMPQVRILSLRPIPVFIRRLSTKIAVLTAVEAAGETLRLF